MTRPGDDIQICLDAIRRGAWDELNAAQMERLEQRLNTDPELAALFAEVPAEPDLAFDAPTPSDAEWDRMWSAVRPNAGRVRTIGRIYRMWSGVGAAAACLVMAILWQFGPPTTGIVQEQWEIELATNVEVLEISVSGDATSWIDHGGENEATIIWFDGAGS